MGSNLLAIIPARGGSKRIPRKNLRSFLGKPIIFYSIQAALDCGLFNEVMVSTDDEEIASLAQSFGASVPFLRSTKTSDDFATTADVITEVILRYQDIGKSFEVACCLYPTAPFVDTTKLEQAFELLQNSQAECVIPITRFNFPIWRGFRRESQGKVSYLWPDHAPKRSQDLEPTFHDVGQFYFFKVDPFLLSGKLVGESTLGLEVPELEAQDIDSEIDWQIAELKYKLLHGLT